MFLKLVSHNNDLHRLVEKGYAVAFDSGYLVVRDIPYLDGAQNLMWGAIVTKLVFVDQTRVTLEDHQIFFAGGVPHNVDGSPVRNLGGGSHALSLSAASQDVVVQRSFSNKPIATGKFEDFFDKIESYATLIGGPASNLHGVNPYTFRAVKESSQRSVFKYHDTLTSKAELVELSTKFENDVVAVIGLGGTGAYILDFLAKTPVREIRGYDLDPFHVHNAFRSPGKLNESELGKSKAEVYSTRYSDFRNGLSIKPKFVDASCADDFEEVTFAFVCVDKGTSRAGVFDLLISKGIPFIDVGMGLNRKDGGPLKGMLRATYFPRDRAQQIRDEGLAETSDSPENIYRTNIQIGELNALNAALAMVRFKQLRGFYIEQVSYDHLLFDISDLKIVGNASARTN